MSFNEQVEVLPELDVSVEILIRFLSAVPGWSEKNVQVPLYLIFSLILRNNQSSDSHAHVNWPKVILLLSLAKKCRSSSRLLRLLPTLPQKHQNFPKNVLCFAYKVHFNLFLFHSLSLIWFYQMCCAVLLSYF